MEQDNYEVVRSCKIYKGIDTPCKIKGLICKYFYLMFVFYGFGGLILMLEFSSVKDGNYSDFIFKAIIIGIIILIVRIYFIKISNKKKIKLSKKRVYISTRPLYKSLK